MTSINAIIEIACNIHDSPAPHAWTQNGGYRPSAPHLVNMQDNTIEDHNCSHEECKAVGCPATPIWEMIEQLKKMHDLNNTTEDHNCSYEECIAAGCPAKLIWKMIGQFKHD